MYQIDSSKRYNVFVTCGDISIEHENVTLLAVEPSFIHLMDEDKEVIYTGVISVCITEE